MAGPFFDRHDHELVALIDAHVALAAQRGRGEPAPRPTTFHPNGLTELGSSKAIRVAWAVMGLIDDTLPSTAQDRLDALRALRAEACSAARTPFRLNTARALVQLMKELLRARGDVDEQLRLAHDFNKAASGRPRIVRTVLHRYNLMEMPEAWNQRSFDYHVHDSHSSGRKSPTHLIMDAWLKGIRTLKVIYDDYAPPVPAAELIAAAEIMDVTVRIGIRFHRFFRGTRVTVVWTPRGFSGPRGFTEFLELPPMQALIAEGRRIDSARAALFAELVADYNRGYRRELDRRFAIAVPPLEMDEFVQVVGVASPSWAHLADCIHRRTVAALREHWPELSRPPQTDDAATLARHRASLEAMEQFSPATVLDDWLAAAIAAGEARLARSVPRLAEETPAELLERLDEAASDYRASIDSRNLTPSQVLQLLFLCHGRITHLELFELRTFRPDELPRLGEMNELREIVNSGNPARFKRLVSATLAATPFTAVEDVACLERLLGSMREVTDHYRRRPLSAFVGSSSSGRSDWGGQHGMGFVIVETLPVTEQRACYRRGERRPLPLRLSLRETIERDTDRAIVARAKLAEHRALAWWVYWFWRLVGLFSIGRREWTAPLESLEVVDAGNVLPLGGVGVFPGNRLDGGGPSARRAPAWSYLNTLWINLAFVAAGFLPAMLAFRATQTGFLALWGAPLWFFVTGSRNILQAVISGGGLRSHSDLRWTDYVSWTRLSESLFYTGFSVPLLELGVRYLVLQKGLGLTAATNPATVFLVIAAVNGIYLMSHNLYRGLPTAAAYANLGRSLSAAPVAVLYNAILYSMLKLADVPNAEGWLIAASTLVAKTASDTAAAVIEGHFDRQATARLRKQDVGEVMSALLDRQAALELCFPEASAVDLLARPAALMRSERREVRRIAAEITIHCLDLMYFHFNQPLAAQSIGRFSARMQPEDRAFVLEAQNLLDLEEDVGRILGGEAFALPSQAAFAFYRDHHRRFREVLPKLLGLTTRSDDSTDHR
jgi:hypothetical protein